MSYILLEWTEFLVRWLHVIAGIAWIGSSFYFIALDLSLIKRKDIPKNAHGEAWQVHGGGFYQIVKYLVAPEKLPSQLTWFKWEAYGTWISGFLLLILVYYISADLYMIEIEKFDISHWEAISLSLIGIILGWVLYNFICKKTVRFPRYELRKVNKMIIKVDLKITWYLKTAIIENECMRSFNRDM